jgi:hypothetical protein
MQIQSAYDNSFKIYSQKRPGRGTRISLLPLYVLVLTIRLLDHHINRQDYYNNVVLIRLPPINPFNYLDLHFGKPRDNLAIQTFFYILSSPVSTQRLDLCQLRYLPYPSLFTIHTMLNIIQLDVISGHYFNWQLTLVTFR